MVPTVTEVFELAPNPVFAAAPNPELPKAEVAPAPKPDVLKVAAGWAAAAGCCAAAAPNVLKADCCWPRDWTGGPWLVSDCRARVSGSAGERKGLGPDSEAGGTEEVLDWTRNWDLYSLMVVWITCAEHQSQCSPSLKPVVPDTWLPGV